MMGEVDCEAICRGCSLKLGRWHDGLPDIRTVHIMGGGYIQARDFVDGLEAFLSLAVFAMVRGLLDYT